MLGPSRSLPAAILLSLLLPLFGIFSVHLPAKNTLVEFECWCTSGSKRKKKRQEGRGTQDKALSFPTRFIGQQTPSSSSIPPRLSVRPSSWNSSQLIISPFLLLTRHLSIHHIPSLRLVPSPHTPTSPFGQSLNHRSIPCAHSLVDRDFPPSGREYCSVPC
ncbi:hypothetical protein F4861DRAFT_340850 [Xylaria intraflava]|nr:hypothetical protein F4861DRAFT_340850 [Xylaria intraflava]